jgi:hypothetical protein
MTVISDPLPMTQNSPEASFDDRLREYLIEIYSGNEHRRAIAMEKLLALTPRLPGIRRSSHLLYLEAVNRTLEDVKRTIDRFPNKFSCNVNRDRATIICEKYVRFVNAILNRDIQNLDRQRKLDKITLSLDAQLSEYDDSGKSHLSSLSDTNSLPDLSTLDYSIKQWQEQENRDQFTILQRYVERDPEGKLTEKCIKKCAECNCQAIVLAWFFNEPQLSKRDFAQQWGVNEHTAWKHWQRNCKNILKLVWENIENYRYLLDTDKETGEGNSHD